MVSPIVKIQQYDESPSAIQLSLVYENGCTSTAMIVPEMPLAEFRELLRALRWHAERPGTPAPVNDAGISYADLYAITSI